MRARHPDIWLKVHPVRSWRTIAYTVTWPLIISRLNAKPSESVFDRLVQLANSPTRNDWVQPQSRTFYKLAWAIHGRLPHLHPNRHRACLRRSPRWRDATCCSQFRDADPRRRTYQPRSIEKISQSRDFLCEDSSKYVSGRKLQSLGWMSSGVFFCTLTFPPHRRGCLAAPCRRW